MLRVLTRRIFELLSRTKEVSLSRPGMRRRPRNLRFPEVRGSGPAVQACLFELDSCALESFGLRLEGGQIVAHAGAPCGGTNIDPQRPTPLKSGEPFVGP